MDYKEYARQLRENAVKDDNGVIRCSPELWEQIASVIETIPTADVEEVKHGEWVKCQKLYGIGYEYVCSACKKGIKQYEGQLICCECGAKMDGGKVE